MIQTPKHTYVEIPLEKDCMCIIAKLQKAQARVLGNEFNITPTLL